MSDCERRKEVNQERIDIMKKLIASVCAVAMMTCALTAHAMPSQDEISEVQPLVARLMGPSVAAFKAKKMSGSEVGDEALKLAEEAEGEAAKFLCMKGAVSYYVKDKEYDKAAKTIEDMMEQFPDMPAETLQEITSSATKGVSAKSAPKLFEIHGMAKKKAANANKLKTVKKQLKEKPADKGLIRQYAELSAANGNWEEALKYFAKLGGDVGKMAKNEIEGKASSVTLAGFWWDYKVQEAGAKDAIRQHSAMYYQNAIDSGELKGLNKTLAEKCIAEVEASPAAQSSNASKLKKDLIHRWSFNGNFKDSIGKSEGKTIGDNVKFEKGQVRLCPGGGYIDLGANIIPAGEAEYTIEIWATKYSIQFWARVFQVADNWGNADYYWSWNYETNASKWGMKFAGTHMFSTSHNDGTGIGVENHFVVVYSHDKEKKAYFDLYILRGGNIYWYRKVRGGWFTSQSAFWLGHGVYDESTPDATYNEVRIWKRALTEEEVMRSAKLGPDKLP